jgi:hypothetical protein
MEDHFMHMRPRNVIPKTGSNQANYLKGITKSFITPRFFRLESRF